MRQNPESSGSDLTTSEKGKEKDLTLGDIVEDLTSYLKKFSHFKKYENDIRKKYEKYYNTALPDRWPVEFINKAWRKTKTDMSTFSGRRKCWSLAILLQVMKRSQGYDESEAEEEKNHSHDEGKGEEEKNHSHDEGKGEEEKNHSHDEGKGEEEKNHSRDEGKGEEPSDQKENNQQSGGDPSANGPVYIRIPFLEMINDKKCKAKDTDAIEILESPQNQYKLIDKVPSPTQILQNHSYITLYDNQTRNAAWVYEILNKSTRANKDVVQRNIFKRDPSVHPLFQTPEGEDTYANTGYDRGHLAAAANHRWCQRACDDTFWLSNVVPQQRYFNCGLWKDLEELCRKTANKEEVCNVHVYTGPLYLSSDNKKENDQNKIEKRVEYKFLGGKAVPTHLFKVIIVENENGKVLEPECYKMPNEKIILVKVTDPSKSQTETEIIEELRETVRKYKVTIEDIERDSGLIFKETEIREEMMVKTWKVQWSKAKESLQKSGTKIEVKLSGSYTDHRDRAVLH